MQNKISQKGQAFVEMLVSIIIIFILMFGTVLVWRYIETKQLLQSSARFALWERTVWEQENNSIEKHAMHRSEESLVKGALVHVLSLPSAWRHERSSGNGAEPAAASSEMRRQMVKPGLRAFIGVNANPLDLMSIETSTKLQMGWWVGQDPTMNTTTSLELDREVYRTVKVSMQQNIPVMANWQGGLFGFSTPNIEMSQSMSIIANAWAASLPVHEIRSDRQLAVFSNGHSVSGTKGNFLATFGQTSNRNAVTLGDFVGMEPWWNFVGGINGLGGQYVVHEIGLNASQALGLLQTGQFNWDGNKSPMENLFMKPQVEQKEFYQSSSAITHKVRRSVIIDKTKDSKEKVPRNSVQNCCRKYMAFPIGPDQYYGGQSN